MIVCAVSSWSAWTIAILPAELGSFSATRPITATWSPIWIMIGRRSSTTSPFSVCTNFDLSSSSFTSCRWVAVVVSTQAFCTRGRSSAATAARSAPERARPARTGAKPLLSRVAAPRSPPPRRRSRTAGRPRCSRPAFGSRRLDHVLRDRLEPGLVERRMRDVVRQHPHEGEQDRQNGQHARADRTPPGRPAALRNWLGFGHRASRRSPGAAALAAISRLRSTDQPPGSDGRRPPKPVRPGKGRGGAEYVTVRTFRSTHGNPEQGACARSFRLLRLATARASI